MSHFLTRDPTLLHPLFALAIMADSLVSSLQSLSINATPLTQQQAANAEADWASTLPEGVIATKTLLFKPKTAKSAQPKPVLIVALESTDVGSANVLAKEIGVKDIRAAQDDLWTEWLGAGKDAASPLHLSSKSAPDGSHPITLVIDNALSKAAPETKLAFHAGSSTEAISITVAEFNKFVESLKVETQHVDFVELKNKAPLATTAAAPGAPRPASAKSNATSVASSSKQSAKIEDAELIGITVRKAGDFSEWYQQVLKKGDMLDYYDVSGCYILKPWSYSVWEAIQGESL